jgi:hypothetical protein
MVIKTIERLTLHIEGARETADRGICLERPVKPAPTIAIDDT